ncbi:oxidoreductase [Biscogniauxia marginata]|nr:oxidoreductase [Biscogniauxia marginata]
MDVNGVVLVVGAGNGIGLETALTFAERGARANRTIAISVDVRDRESVKVMVEEVKKQFGRLDYAVNSAGVKAETSSVNETEYDLLHDVNAKGILHCLQEEISVMKGQEPLYVEGRSGRRSVGPGSIINVTSLSAVIGTAKSITYTASKFAARGIVNGLRINEVCPGFTDTPMLRRGIEKQPGIGEILNRSMPLGRIATPEEIANVVHFLASPGASFVNGQSLVVDSGVSVNVLA